MLFYTLGHSTRGLEDFLSLLKHYGIKRVVDVRHWPTSKKFPWFSRESLEKELPKNGIDYVWLEALGGYRRGGYAKYTESKDYAEGIKKLEKLASKKTTAVMCAEVLWFKCHRRYIADTLAEESHKAVHIYDEKRAEEHKPRERMRSIRCDRG